MSPERWARLEALLDELLELSPAQRREALDRGDLDGELREELEALLALPLDPADPLDHPASELAAELLSRYLEPRTPPDRPEPRRAPRRRN